jgi:cytosine/adenosine deaminase-related metal-dependent hydrolase
MMGRDWLFPLLLANGVTGVRELGTRLPFERINQIRQETLEGKILGPRYGAVTGRVFDGAGSIILPQIAVETPQQARNLVREYKQQGMDFIKVYNLLSREVYLAVIDEAKRQRIPVAGHVPFSMTASEVSDLGQISLEHVQVAIFVACSRDEAELWREWQELIKGRQRGAGLMIMAKAVATYDEKKAQSFFALLRRNGTSVCPTSIVFRPVELVGDENTLLGDSRMKYIPDVTRRRWREAFQQRTEILMPPAERKARSDLRIKIVGAMQRAGIRLLAGSDAPNPYIFPGFSLHDELELLVRAGLSPLEALQTATVNPAKFLGIEKEIGTIEKGKLADLILLDANPLVDISNTKKINAVVANGRFLDRTVLDKMLTDVETVANKK